MMQTRICCFPLRKCSRRLLYLIAFLSFFLLWTIHKDKRVELVFFLSIFSLFLAYYASFIDFVLEFSALVSLLL